MTRSLSTALLGCLVIPGAVCSGAEPLDPNEEKYSFLHRKPAPLRELSTDRPDKTESAYTVDAGHFQVEADLVNYSYDTHEPSFGHLRTEGLSVATANLKVGLCDRSDLQVVVPTYNWVRTKHLPSGTVTENSGFGDLVVRNKINIWGNDDGQTAFAVMPYLKLPTNQDGLGNKAWEGGLILPLAIQLPGEWNLGLMTQFDFVEDASGSGYHPDFVNSITASHSIVGNLSGYVEFFSLVSTDTGSDWIGTVDAGLTYGLSENVQLDAGINIGVTRAADDFNPFLGISFRY